jgi:diguanylate cyclase (GGDEF)-like protein
MLTPLLATGSYVEQTLRSRPALDDSITGSAVLLRKIICLAPGDPLMRQHVMPGTPTSDSEAILFAPLEVGDEVVGTLNVWREYESPSFLPEEVLLVKRFASLAALAYANSAQRDRLRIQALTDELTGLFNRRHFERCLSSVLSDERERGRSTSLIYFDIDAFKLINDTYGHGAGDEVLCAFAEVLRGQIRSEDIPCRTGGEEFCVVLPRATRDEAAHVADRIVNAVRAARLGPRGDLTVSAGVVTSLDSGHDRERLVLLADEHLMRAKREGRDRVIVGDLACA